VDGVIAINASVLERLLRVVGPISSDTHDVVLHSDTALQTLQHEVESKNTPEKIAAPKAILGDITEQFMKQLSDTSSLDAMRLLGELHEALSQKEIQVYMHDEATQNLFRSYGWTGEVVQTSPNQDFLMVNTANIAGAKSDANISQTISHEAVVQADGSIEDTVTVKRVHTGDSSVPLYGQPNVSYVRLYVPAGAELLDAGGFSYPAETAFRVPESWYKKDVDLSAVEQSERIDVNSGTRITQEFGKTVFGNWVITMPGDSSVYYVKYKLPFTAFSSGGILEQPSISDRIFVKIYKMKLICFK
jgi:hypothetical protein